RGRGESRPGGWNRQDPHPSHLLEAWRDRPRRIAEVPRENRLLAALGGDPLLSQAAICTPKSSPHQQECKSTSSSAVGKFAKFRRFSHCTAHCRPPKPWTFSCRYTGGGLNRSVGCRTS